MVELVDERQELVAHGPHRADESWMVRVIPKLSSEPAQVDIDRAVNDPGIVLAVDRIDQVVTTEHAPRPAHEAQQQPELERREIERATVELYLDPVRIHFQAVCQEDRLILFCQEGYSSSLAAVRLQELGYPNTTDVIGGFHAWSSAGLPVERD